MHLTLKANNSRKTYSKTQSYNISNLANGKAKTEVLEIEIHCRYFIIFHKSIQIRKECDQKTESA